MLQFTFETFALKMIETSVNGMNTEKFIKNEIRVMESVQHVSIEKNILKLKCCFSPI